MTVETTKNKTDKQVMGSLTYDFDFDCLLQDPTEENAKKAIKVTISDGVQEYPLEYGTDYSVALNSNGFGGTVTVADGKDATWQIVIYREYDLSQGSEYKDYNAFPAKTLEGNMDKSVMLAQQLQEQLDRSVKTGITSDIDPDVIVAQVERVYSSIDNVDTVADDIANVNIVAGDKANVDVVAGIAANVTTVAGISSDVSTVASNNANVSTVATNISDVNAVGGDIAKVTAVADDLTNIDAVNANKSNIDDVAADLTNIDAVAADLTNIDAVAGDLSNIDAVKGNATNINAVAGNATNINAVNANKANIDAVAGNATNINAVNANKTNIDTVAGNISDVNTVAGISTNVSTVAGMSSDISAVVANETNINDVAADLSNINSVAGDLSNIDAASSYAASSKQWAVGEPTEPTGGSAKYWAGQAAQGQIQSDWSQTDNTKKDFIKNKPTKLSDFTDSTATTPIARATADASGNTITTTYATKTELSGEASARSGADTTLQQNIDKVIPTLLQNYGRADFIHAKLLNSAYEGETYVEMWTDGATNVFDKTTLQIEPCVIKLTVDGVDRAWHNTSTIDFVPASNLDSGSSLSAGKNYYIYLVPDGTGCKLIVSLNASYPSGYTATNSRKIGWFHTLCVAAGSISGHLASGYSAGDIIPNSVACLSFRPKCDPSGMAYIDIIDSWVDIYLQSGTGSSTVSAYGGTITDTRYYGNHCRDMAKVGKTLPSSNDFSIFAFGSNEKTAISGAADPVTTGGHKDSNNRRMISQYFIEDCCGALWQWLDDEGPCGGSNWTDITLDDNASSSWYGSLFVLLAGGNWANGAHCGSGCRAGDHGRSTLGGFVSARGLSRNIALSIA